MSIIVHKSSFKALDRTLREIRDSQVIFGGKTVVLAGYFRQTLPVILTGTSLVKLALVLSLP